MKISLSWLRDYLKTAQTAEQLAETLTRSGLEVKSIETHGAAIPKVVAAQILESTQHPDADRLSICKVDDGSGAPRQIVCGAKNYKVGDKILLALPGAALPGGVKIKVGKLRGVESEGMMCSSKELGLGEGVDGLHILPPETVIGTELGELFPADDILELEITPNRPDWLGYVGVAREAAAFGAGEFLKSKNALPPTLNDSSIAIATLEACPFYSLRFIHAVKIADSPSWLSQRLGAIGARPINVVVDVANYVMFETGQPLHAFDAAKIKGVLTVRFAKQGETLLALDGKTYALLSSDLVIADENGPQALAGIIGGKASSVTENTESVLLESAVFNPSVIRALARFHGIATDASYRFERGTQATTAMAASARATSLILELAGGVAAKEIVIAGALPQPTVVPLGYNRCRQLLGTDISDELIISYLKKLGLVEKESAWQIPSWRLDLTREIDLIEEVARLHGMKAIASRCVSFSAPSSQADKIYDAAITLRRRLAASGFYEGRTSALVPRDAASSEALALRNPMGEQQSVLRTSLLRGLMEVVKYNLCQGANSLRFFEIGKTFHALSETNAEEELQSLALIMTGHAAPVSWRGESERSLDLYDLKGIINRLVPEKITYRPSNKTLLPGMALMLDIFCEDQLCGYVGLMAPAEARKLMVTGQGHSIAVAELTIAALQSAIERGSWKRAGGLLKFPAVTRDLAMVVGKNISYGSLEKELYAAKEEFLKSIVPIDVFIDPTGEKIDADKKSVALSLKFQHDDRTLTAQEVGDACEKLVALLKQRFGAEVRGYTTSIK